LETSENLHHVKDSRKPVSALVIIIL
jgi:hypothetical protein